jgi:hypothetical protein
VNETWIQTLEEAGILKTVNDHNIKIRSFNGVVISKEKIKSENGEERCGEME